MLIAVWGQDTKISMNNYLYEIIRFLSNHVNLDIQYTMWEAVHTYGNMTGKSGSNVDWGRGFVLYNINEQLFVGNH